MMRTTNKFHLSINNSIEIMTPPRLNLLVDGHCFDHEHQGSRRFITEIYRILQYRKEIKLHLAAYDTNRLKNIFSSADIVFIPYISRSPVIRLLYDLPGIIKKYRIDYAHFQYMGPLVKNCHHIITIHDMLYLDQPKFFPFTYRFIRRFLFKSAALQATILTTVSGYSKHSISNSTGIPKDKIKVIPNGVSKQFFQSTPKDVARIKIFSKYGFDKIILFVCRIEPRKNHINLVRAFVELMLYKKNYHLVMVGHQSIAVPRLRSLMNQLPDNVKNFIHFADQVNEEELMDFYRSAELFVYPSLAEGFGIPPLEAAASETPVVCSNTTAMAPYTFFDKNHIDPENLHLLKTRISETLEHHACPYDVRQVAERMKKEYSWDASAEKLLHHILEHAGLNERKKSTWSMEDLHSTVTT